MVDTLQRFKGMCCYHLQGRRTEAEGTRFLWHLVRIYKITRRHTPEDSDLDTNCYEILKSHTVVKFHVTIGPVEALPVSLLQLVTVNFWALNSLLDPALIEDTHVFEDFVPSWMNHSLHSHVLVFTLAELLLSCRTYPRWTALGRLRSTVVVLAYASWWVCAHFCSVVCLHSRWLTEHVTWTSFSASFARNIDRSELRLRHA